MDRYLIYFLTIIIIGLFIGVVVFIYQHITDNDKQDQALNLLNISLLNQHNIMENQNLIKNQTVAAAEQTSLIKNFTENLIHHENEELKAIELQRNISLENGNKLDMIQDKLDKVFRAANIQ